MVKTLTKQTIGVGVAGTGFIGPAHIEGLRRNRISVPGLAEFNKETVQQKAAELGIPCSFGSLDEMLADSDIDIVHLATPNYLHHPHAKAALLAGKHVICEILRLLDGRSNQSKWVARSKKFCRSNHIT
jgi:Predicted dehydrogenases and related proteins